MKIPIITGPTATGKTAAVLGLAQNHDIEIISADAYQVYRFMDIGTAKPSKQELDAAPHHLIDIMNPDETYSAGKFFEQAEIKIKDILDRGKLPVVTGGTGMYVESLQKGIFNAPDRDKSFRESLEKRIIEEGSHSLYSELEGIDPEFAAKVKPTDPTRIIRGLEINGVFSMNVAAAQKKYHRNPSYEYNILVLTADRKKIYDNVDRRVIEMFEKGWAKEVEDLLNMGYDGTLDSFKAIGYREIADCVKNGKNPISVCERIQTATRNFAKRQLTWFRHMEKITYLDVAEVKNIKKLSELIFA